nr:hypothetical protein 3 [Piscirickettsiaceae bacterium]
MTKTQYYIEKMREELKKVLNRKISDKDIYTKLGIAPSRFNRLKNAEEHFNQQHISLIANYVHVPAAQILVEITADKAKTEEEKKTWQEAVKKMVSGFAGVAVVSGATFAPIDKAEAKPLFKDDQTIYYTNYLYYHSKTGTHP